MTKFNKTDILALGSFLALLAFVFLFAVAIGANPIATLLIIVFGAFTAICLVFLLAAIFDG